MRRKSLLFAGPVELEATLWIVRAFYASSRNMAVLTTGSCLGGVFHFYFEENCLKGLHWLGPWGRTSTT